MLASMIRRGPDEQGRYVEDGIALGMRRLSIIDIAHGQQPACDAQRGVQLVFNGEIYNHRELRQQLRARGHRFRTNSDSEVIVKAYLEWGPDMPRRLNGMFAIALWDARDQQLRLIRDQLGQKPLYYWQQGERWVFGSDLQTVIAHPAVPRQLHAQALPDYLRYRHVPGTVTLLEGIQQLPPASMLTIDHSGQGRHDYYWRPEQRAQCAPQNELVEQFHGLWQDAIKRHLIADAPVGLLLSGGIDSSLILAEASGQQAIDSFNISFDERAHDESLHARQIAEHYQQRLHVQPFQYPGLKHFQQLIDAYDQPFADPAALPLLQLSEHTASRVKVALSGDGGDELFGGYQRYRSLLLSQKLRAFPKPLRQTAARLLNIAAKLAPIDGHQRRWLDAGSRRLGLIQNSLSDEYAQQFAGIADQQLRLLCPGMAIAPARASIDPKRPLVTAREHDLGHWLPDQMLVKTDRASMYHSLEIRAPLLDMEIVQFALSLTDAQLNQPNQSKPVLRDYARKRLPDNIRKRPKHGFSVPIDQWLRRHHNWLRSYLFDHLPAHQQRLAGDHVERLWTAHQKGQENHGAMLFTVLTYLGWHERTFR